MTTPARTAFSGETTIHTLEGSFPDSQAWIEKQFSGVPETEIDAMVREMLHRHST